MSSIDQTSNGRNSRRDSSSSLSNQHLQTDIECESKHDKQKKKSSTYLKRIGASLVCLSIVCIVITIPLSVSLHPMSIGSGFWCSVFVFFYGIFMGSSTDVSKPRMVILSFGCVVTYFSLLMVGLEICGIYYSLDDELKEPTVVICLHALLGLLALSESSIILLSMIIYCKSYSTKEDSLKNNLRMRKIKEMK